MPRPSARRDTASTTGGAPDYTTALRSHVRARRSERLVVMAASGWDMRRFPGAAGRAAPRAGRDRPEHAVPGGPPRRGAGRTARPPLSDGAVLPAPAPRARHPGRRARGDYCGECRYDRGRRTGPDACPFNTLYWNFLLTHERRLRANPRLGPAVFGLRRLGTAERRAVRASAQGLLARLDRA